MQLKMFDGDSDPWDHELFEQCDKRLLERFKLFHAENPELYQMMERFSLEAGKTRKRFSIWMVANRVRWYTKIETTGKEFKVSNDYLALYARLIVIANKHLDGLFQFKKMKKIRRFPRE